MNHLDFELAIIINAALEWGVNESAFGGDAIHAMSRLVLMTTSHWRTHPLSAR